MVSDEESSKLVKINTHQGLYQCCQLSFGVAAAPAVFQWAMDSILQGIPFVVCYLDVSSCTKEEHLQNLATSIEAAWTPPQEGQVQFSAEICGILRALAGRPRGTHIAQESEGHPRCAYSSEPR